MKMIFDIDGCILKFWPAFYLFLKNAPWPDDHPLPSFNMEEIITDIPAKEISQKFSEFFTSKTCMQSIPFFENAIEVINRLAQDNQIILCSHLVGSTSRRYRTEYLLEYLEVDHIEYVNKSEMKVDFIASENADIIMEDKDSTVEEFCKAFKSKRIFMPVYDYNKHLLDKYPSIDGLPKNDIWLEFEKRLRK